ncbi:MAG: hypothetical protein ACREDX_02185 [Aestuariivirga sp.]
MMPRLALFIFLAAAVSADAMAQERQWSLDAGDEDAYLVFGVPETDDVGISFWCAMKTGEVNIFVPEADPAMKPGETVPFSVVAGQTVAKLEGRTTANEMSGTASLEAKVSSRHPLFEALRKADRFKIIVGKQETIYPLIDADVDALLRLCGKQ